MTNASETAAEKSPQSKPAAKKKVSRLHRWMIALMVVISLVIMAMGYSAISSVSGYELQSNTWKLREFTFHRDPFTNYQITGIRYSGKVRHSGWTASGDDTHAALSTDITQHFTKQPLRPESRWDLVNYSFVPDKAPAEILVRLLASHRESYDLYWPHWSTDHPKLAAILWPAAQDLTAAGLYTTVPDLLLLAQQHESEVEFQQAIESFMQAALLKQCQSLADAEQTKSAVLLAKLGLSYGDNAQLQEFVQ